MWEIEHLPDDAYLFMRVHKNYYDSQLKKPLPGVFRNVGEGMSTEWNKYSTPQETLDRAKVPDKNGVLSLNVKDVRTVPNQTVDHSPTEDNRAHTNVKGIKEVKERAMFLQIFKWEIIPPV